MSTHPFSESSPLQSAFYRRRDLYSLAWSHSSQDLSGYLVVSAANGGFIAVTRDPRKVVMLGKASALKPRILVYTAAGQLVESIPWDNSNRIAGIGFTSREELAVVLDEGVVRLYTLLSPCPATTTSAASSVQDSSGVPTPVTSTCYYTQYILGTEATETGVVEGKVWEQGIVALTGGGSFVDFRFPQRKEDDDEGIWDQYVSLSAPQVLPQALPVAQGSSTGPPPLPTAWTFLPPTVSASGVLEVLLSPAVAASSGLAPLTNSGGAASSGVSANGGFGRSTPHPPQATPSRGTLIALDSISGPTDMRLTRGPFSSIVASPNGKLLALLTSDKKLWVVSSDFQRSLSEFDVTECEAYREVQESHRSGAGAALASLGQTGIRQIEWCGNNTVALAFDSEVVMVGPFGDSLRYFYSAGIHLVPEVDGVRIIGAERHDFIQKVADSTSAVFRPGSSEASAMLFDASESFSRRSPKADDGIRAIRSELAVAVDTCLDAASQEWDVIWQKRLLRAANFGKSFLDPSSYDPTNFVAVSRRLRVLNNLRSYEIGIPLSYEQFESMGVTALLSRLTNRNHHLLSLRVASHLSQRLDPILKHWARAKIAQAGVSRGTYNARRGTDAASIEDEELCATIVRKFEDLGKANDAAVTVSYSSIATSAFQAGRVRLATKLLDYEPRAVDQVPLLLKMGEDKLALQKSVESGDTDLVYHVLLRLKTQLPRGDFFRLIEPSTTALTSTSGTTSLNDLAVRLLEVYAHSYDRDLLKDLYFTDDRRAEAALLSWEGGQITQGMEQSESSLSQAVFARKDASKLFNEDKERSLESKLVDESIRLLSFQQVLEKDDGGRSQWTGLSLNDTIRECLIKGRHGGQMAKRAEKLRSDWKVPEKRWWAIKLDAYIRMRDWEGLWAFANTKRPPPIGYEPFIAKLLSSRANVEALRYVPKLMSAGDKGDKARFGALMARLPIDIASPLQAKIKEKA
ncbi:hypothetical protein BCV69DRAFT_311398 [Microstroma glucosiphilum]|uniref:Vacuolar protein sorting-associated protein 16 homolog n=1 Tax=Pseudomicrostroma glucosiphilum TaxID=1684307 RepID=A0A316UBV6_9BASI|nr:hypothetical protein BCV69DRAFT_311398 [Pseudomicrostroma glucosiphilum]PWN22612.1 hypothetical protein BCV69DRAFT_311398 [Pseudomicrostroma glucosiphilum]